MGVAPRRVRAEARARYFIRDLATARGWNVAHVARGGDFLEENEIEAHFPNIGLVGSKPDFLACIAGEPAIVVEAKNELQKLDQAVTEACEYADAIIENGQFRPLIAIGAAGEQDRGFLLEVRYRTAAGWQPLLSMGQALTSFPTKREVELALESDDASTDVSVPASHEFIDAALEISSILRRAKIEAPLRPKVIGATTLAMYQGTIELSEQRSLASVNELVTEAVRTSGDLADARKEQLVDALHLSRADFDRLSPFVGRIVAILRSLNIRAVLHTDTDFLGLFYEAFLRYGYDNNALGIVFTPRHITRMCVDILAVGPRDRVIDIACGTGGFLVSAFDRMLRHAESVAAVEQIKQSVAGFDANPTVWSLSMLNMFFRGDGKSAIQQGDGLEGGRSQAVARRFTRAFLNPPFSQDEEPEYLFIDASMEALEPGGLLAAVVYAGVFADEDHQNWRRGFLARHSLVGMISLPEDLFYPTAAPTSIMIARAHIPQPQDGRVFMARVWNDGFAKLKGRRVACEGSQIPEVEDAFARFMDGNDLASELATVIRGELLLGGAEWSPQQWLPQPHAEREEIREAIQKAGRSILQAIAKFPEAAEVALEGLEGDDHLPELPLGRSEPVNFFFDVINGRSTGEKNYQDGTVPYVSSGDTANSVIGLKAPVEDELFATGGVTVTAFGTAALQPWPFLGRGNGGSAVRVLRPRYKMSEADLLWFVAQINLQNWRFFYARMSIKSRLQHLVIESPPEPLEENEPSLPECVRQFRRSLDEFSASIRY